MKLLEWIMIIKILNKFNNHIYERRIFIFNIFFNIRVIKK